MPLAPPARGVAAAAIGLALTACTASVPPPVSPTPTATPVAGTPCGDVATAIVDALQAYVDSFGEVEAAGVRSAATVRSAELQQAAATLRERATEAGCEATALAGLVRADIGRLRGGTPVQDAVAATFRADPLGTLDPSDPGRQEFSVSSTAELLAAVAASGDGSVIRLEAGTFELAEPLVLLRPLSLVGAGESATVVTSAAGGATLVGATDGTLRVNDLTVAHTGSRPASVAMVVAGGYDLQRVTVQGGRSGPDGGGFGLVLRPQAGALSTAPPAFVGDHLTATDNAAGGIVVAGDHSPALTSLVVRGTDGCAVCFVEDASGTVSGLVATESRVGVRVDHAAVPLLGGLRVTDAEVGLALTGSGAVRVNGATLEGGAVGVQAVGSGRLELSGATITDAAELGLRLSGTTTTVLDGLEVTGATPVGVATVGDARVEARGGRIATTGDAGFVVGERAVGTLSGGVIEAARLGVQLGDAARADLTDVRLAARDASLLAAGTTEGSLSGISCAQKPVVLRESTTVELRDSPTCEIVRE